MNDELRRGRGNSDGFTLIETLIYAVLTTFILTFAILTTYQFIENADRLRYQRELAENKKFLEQKIYWTLQNISAINAPAANATSTSLSIDKLSYASNPVVVDTTDWIARLKKGSGGAIPITSDYVAVQNLTFHQFNFSGRPAIKVSGTLFNSYSSTTADLNFIVLTK
mgnify:FL=1